MEPPISGLLAAVLLLASPAPSESSRSRGCDLAYASYYLVPNLQRNLTYIAPLFDQSVLQIKAVNPQTTNTDFIIAGTSINISFSCDGLSNGEFLGHYFNYTTLSGDTYTSIVTDVYVNLTSVSDLEAVNSYSVNNIPSGASVRVLVNCSCGDASISKKYGLFATYPLKVGDTLSSVASQFNFSDTNLLQEYNPGVNFASGSGIVFVPTTGIGFMLSSCSFC